MFYVFATRWPPYRPLIGGEFDCARNFAASLSACAPVKGLAFRNPNVTPPQTDRLSWTLLDHQDRSRMMSLFSALPNVAYRNLEAGYVDALYDLAQGAEAVFVDFIAMAWVVAPLLRRFAGDAEHPPVIMINHNHEHEVRLQMTAAARSPVLKAAMALDTWKAGRLERRANTLSDGFVVLTAADGESIAREVGTPWVAATPGYEGARRTARTLTQATPLRACILGNHLAQHKRMVLATALETLSRQPTAVELEVVGAGDHAALAQEFPSVRFRGYVEDIEAYLDGVRVGLMPDAIGGGFKNRALMYAANRVPMLALHQALAGMGFEPGVHYEGVDTLEEMAAALPRLAGDLPRLNRLQEAAYDHVATAYDWADRGRDLHDFAKRLMAA